LATDGDGTTAEILALEARYVEAWRVVDVPFIEQATAADALWINDRGRVAGKDESLALYGSGRIRLESSEETDLAVRVYGDAAVVTGTWAISGSAGGEARSGRLRFTRVWVRDGREWRMASWQGTEIAV